MIKKSLFVSLSLILAVHALAQLKADTMMLKTVDVIDSVRNDLGNLKTYRFDSIQYVTASSTHGGQFLQANTGIFVKDSGPGASSSLTYRGGSAYHTKVYWEGISIENSMLGQSDASLLQTDRYLGLEFVKAGNSLSLGSGGFGGILNFKPGTDLWNIRKTDVGIEMGSFGRKSIEANLLLGNGKLKFESMLNVSKSTNDFPYLNYLNNSELEVRENAGTSIIQWIPKLSLRLNEYHELSVGGWITESDRNVPSAIGTSNGNATQKDHWRKLMASWNFSKSKYSIRAKSALMHDRLDYVNPQQGIQSDNLVRSSKNLIQFNHLISRYFSNEIQLKADFYRVISNNYDDAVDEENFGINESLMLHVRNTFITGNLRLEKWRNSDVAVMPSLLSRIKPFGGNKNLELFLDLSYNVRFPSFNELYWQDLGNPDLKEEIARTIEGGVRYQLNKTSATSLSTQLGLFRSTISEMIIWLPDASGLWKPENQHKVSNNGAEADIDFAFKETGYSFYTHVNYSYTRSIPYSDSLSEFQQIYIPLHKLAYSLSLGVKKYYITYNQVINSILYIDVENSSYLPVSAPANLEIGRTFDLPNAKINFSLGMQNILNESYQYVAHMPMPLRNYKAAIHIYL